MNYAPVVLFVYNRADHFEKTYEALAKCEEVPYTDLFIFSDGAKNSKAEDGVNNVRGLARKIAQNNNFKSVKVIESPVNKGLAKSIINGVSQVVEEYGKVIVLEDDCFF